jgi:two-component system response regulator RpfG
MNVLIIDDQASQRTMFRHLLEDISPEIRVADFSDPVNALLWTRQVPPDLVILDYRMPKMDGLEFARQFRRPLSQRDVPIVLVTVVGDEPLRQAALEAGVIDFLVKPIRPRELRSRCKNLLELRQRQQSLKSRTHALEHRLHSGMHEMDYRERDLLTRVARIASLREACDTLHLERIAQYSRLLAEAIGLGRDEVRSIELAAPLHDLGNIGVADAILQKPGLLSDGERAQMQRHVLIGAEMLCGSNSSFIGLAAEIVLCHHERWDGSGYPYRLSGDAIPVAGQVVGLADVFDALTTPRSYRMAMAPEAALRFLGERAGRSFAPRLLAALHSCRDAVAAVPQLATHVDPVGN